MNDEVIEVVRASVPEKEKIKEAIRQVMDEYFPDNRSQVELKELAILTSQKLASSVDDWNNQMIFYPRTWLETHKLIVENIIEDYHCLAMRL